MICFNSHIDGLSSYEEFIVYGIDGIFFIQVFFQPLTETVLVVWMYVVYVFVYRNVFYLLVIAEYPGI